MLKFAGPALVAVALALATTASAAPTLSSPASRATHAPTAVPDKKPADCATMAEVTAKPQSAGDGTAKPADAAASPAPAEAVAVQLAAVDGSGGVKPAGPATPVPAAASTACPGAA